MKAKPKTKKTTGKKKVLAQDIMQKKLITMSPDATAAEAIETFEEYHIGGAPVVDGGGRLLGVLTVSDVTRKEHVVDGRLSTERAEYYLANPLDEDGFGDDLSGMQNYNPSGPETVKDWMTPSIISVAPTASLEEVCKVMVRESVHRVLIVEEDLLRGIVSSFDIVRHMARET